MMPPKAQLQVEPDTSAGIPPSVVCAAPGTHGEVTGTHGIGVSTPSAAAVALATVGLATLVHIPNGMMFTNGAQSMIVAAGRPSTITRGVGVAVNVEGAMPKLHVMTAPVTAF